MADWVVGASRDLPTNAKASWDGSAAAGRIFDWAGGDGFDAAKAKRGFLVYDRSADDVRASFKLPFADVLDGTLTAIKGGVNAAASRLPQTAIGDDVKDRARSVIDAYQETFAEEKSAPLTPVSVRRGKYDVELRSAADYAGEIRLAEHVDGFTGHVATWWTVDSYGTAMAPGSFKRSIQHRDPAKIHVLLQHNTDIPLGKHLEVREDKTGLFVDTAICDDGAEGTTFLRRLRFGVPFALSFGFRHLKDRAGTDEDPLDFAQMPGMQPSDVRVYTENAYWESSAVTFPANERAAIESIRSTWRLEALSSFPDAIRAGDASSAELALCAEIVDAVASGPGPGSETADHSTPDEARVQRLAAGKAALARFALHTSGVPAWS